MSKLVKTNNYNNNSAYFRDGILYNKLMSQLIDQADQSVGQKLWRPLSGLLNTQLLLPLKWKLKDSN